MDARIVDGRKIARVTDDGKLKVLVHGRDGDDLVPVTLSGNIAEKASAQHSESATTVRTYARAAGAARIEVYVESGRVRIRTDGQPCTAVSGEPLGEGFGAAWAVPSISVLFIDDSAVTVVSR